MGLRKIRGYLLDLLLSGSIFMALVSVAILVLIIAP